MKIMKSVSVSIIDTCSDYQEELNYHMLEKTGKELLVSPKMVITVLPKLLVIENYPSSNGLGLPTVCKSNSELMIL
jgi:hypothetical protein